MASDTRPRPTVRHLRGRRKMRIDGQEYRSALCGLWVPLGEFAHDGRPLCEACARMDATAEAA